MSCRSACSLTVRVLSLLVFSAVHLKPHVSATVAFTSPLTNTRDLLLYSAPQRNDGGSPLRPRSMQKRDKELFPDLLQQYSEKQVDTVLREEYKAVPFSIVLTTQMIQRSINCSAIKSVLHQNMILPELQLRPDWIHTSERIGDCPTHYVTRVLPPLYSPGEVLEAVCTCGGSQCSREGHQCVPVTRHIPVWVRRGPDFHVLDVEEVSVACACVRRPSVGGNFIFTSAVLS